MKNIKFYIILIAATIITACDNFVQVDLPESLLTGSQVFDDPNTVRAALANTYSKLRDEGILAGRGSGSGTSFGLYSDELISYGLAGSAIDNIYNNTLPPANPTAQSYWNTAYHQIYCANAVIEGLNNSKTINESEKKLFKGEALFIRALVHFYLCNIFGSVPYVSTTDLETNKRIPRTSSDKIYSYIINDLLQAEELLPVKYVSSERTIPNRAAAVALLARIYLYNKNWAEAANSASALINDSSYNLNDPLDMVFLKGSASTIWQFKPSSDKANAYESSSYIFTSVPPPSVSLKNELIAAFEPGDNRRQQWIKEVNGGAKTYYHPYKYRHNTTTTVSVEYSVVLRIAEQYLIRSEARAQQGDLIGALEDLNKIRRKAGLPESNASSIPMVLNSIENERRVELFTEYGHRFFDLKRTGRLELLSTMKPGWDQNDIMWPIPENELLSNPALLPQNPGY